MVPTKLTTQARTTPRRQSEERKYRREQIAVCRRTREGVG
jgi:hypothetical protein